MTLCDETLEARIKRGGLESRDSRISTCRQLCDGIAYLHLLAEAIAHRDLKPSNILFKGECLKIADMGQSRVLQHGETAVVSTAQFCTALCRFTVSIYWARLFVGAFRERLMCERYAPFSLCPTPLSSIANLLPRWS